MQIQKCELVLIHTYPVGDDSLVSDRPKKEVGGFDLFCKDKLSRTCDNTASVCFQ